MWILFIALLLAPQTLADKIKIFKKNGVIAHLIDKNSTLPAQQLQKYVDTFLTVYPKMIIVYNAKSARNVNLIFDSEYNDHNMNLPQFPQNGSSIYFNVAYFKTNPDDLDVVTFKAMRLILYPAHSDFFTELTIPGYVTRYQFGITKKTTPFSSVYLGMAEFLDFVEKRHKGTVKGLVNAVRSQKTLDNELWKKLTDKTYQDLSEEYSKEKYGDMYGR